MADHDLSRNPIQVETTPRRHRRRDFLTLAAAAVVTGITAPSSADADDPFAFTRVASTDDDHDAAIVDLFRQWRSALAAENAVKERDVDPEVDATTKLAEQIFWAPVSGTVGLAIKTFMLAYEFGAELECVRQWGQQPGEIGRLPDEQYSCRHDWRTDSWSDETYLYVPAQAFLGALASAVRFCPELAPLAAGALSSPRVLPVDDDEDDREDA